MLDASHPLRAAQSGGSDKARLFRRRGLAAAARGRHQCGAEKYLDIIGVNYYPWNQWYYAGPVHAGATIERSHPEYKSFHHLLKEVFRRHHWPLFVAETGTENEARADRLRYVGAEVQAAQDLFRIRDIARYV